MPASPLCWLLADALAETAVVYAAAHPRYPLPTPRHPSPPSQPLATPSYYACTTHLRALSRLSTHPRLLAHLPPAWPRSLWVHFDSLASLPLLRAAAELSGTRYAAAAPRVRHGDLRGSGGDLARADAGAAGDAPDLVRGDLPTELPPGAAEAGEPAPRREEQQLLKMGALEEALAEARAELAAARQGRRADAPPPAMPHRTMASGLG